MFNKQTGASRLQLQDLPVDVARVVDGLEVGEVSSPFTMRLDNGKIICAIVKLKTKIDAHKANVRDDYETLKEMYQTKMGEQRTNDWIREKQKSVYVSLSGDVKKEDFKYPGWVFYEDKK